MKCEHEGCQREASHAPKLCVPAKGWAIDLHQPMALLLSIPLCRDHARSFGDGDDGFKWSENEKLKQAITLTCAASHRAEPDFDRAFFSIERLDGEFYKIFADVRAEQTARRAE